MNGDLPVPDVRFGEIWAHLANGRMWAGKRLVGFPIADIQHENPRDVGKGRLPTLSGSTRVYKAAIEGSKSGHHVAEELRLLTDDYW